MSALLLAALLFSPVAAAAQQQTSTSQDEQPCIWEWLKHRRGKDTTQSKADAEEARRKTDLLLVPIVASKPSTGFVFGAGASLEFPLDFGFGKNGSHGVYIALAEAFEPNHTCWA